MLRGIWKFGWSLCPRYQGTVWAEDQCRSMAQPSCSRTRTENGLYTMSSGSQCMDASQNEANTRQILQIHSHLHG